MGKFIHRVGGAEIPRFGGVRRECDPGAIPPNMFRNAVNVRYQGGRLVSRGGQSKFNTGALSGRVQGIFSSEFEFSTGAPADGTCSEVGVGGGTDIGSEKLYLVGGDTKYIGLYYFGEDQTPLLRRQVYDPARIADTEMASFGDGRIWVGGYDAANVYLRVFSRSGLPTVVASVAQILNTSMFGSIESYEASLYFSVAALADANTRVYRYTGSAIVQDDAPGWSHRPYLRALPPDLYAIRGGFVSGGLAKIRRKSAGVWADLASSLANFAANGQPVIYNGALWALGKNGVSPSFSGPAAIKIVVGGTVTTERDLASSAARNHYYALPAVFNGYLYYLYQQNDPSTAAPVSLHLGRFDGTTWSDTHKDLGTQFPQLVNDGNVPMLGFLGGFDGKLRVVIRDSTYSTCNFNVFSSPDLDTAGTWTSHATHHRKVADTLAQLNSGIGFSNAGAVM